jgi:hypothetical protein
MPGEVIADGATTRMVSVASRNTGYFTINGGGDS